MAGTLVVHEHALGAVEIHGPQGVANQNPGGVLLGRSHRVLQVQNDAIGVVQSRVDEELGLVARQIEAAASRSLTRAGGRVPGILSRQELSPALGTGPPDCHLEAGRQHEGQRPLILHGNHGVGDAESGTPLLDHAVVDLALELDGEPATVAQRDRDPAIGADLLTAAAGFAFSGHGCDLASWGAGARWTFVGPS